MRWRFDAELVAVVRVSLIVVVDPVEGKRAGAVTDRHGQHQRTGGRTGTEDARGGEAGLCIRLQKPRRKIRLYFRPHNPRGREAVNCRLLGLQSQQGLLADIDLVDQDQLAGYRRASEMSLRKQRRAPRQTEANYYQRENNGPGCNC